MKERRTQVEEHAVEVFGDPAIAREWMRRPNGALGKEPRKLLQSAEGIEQVDVILGRIEHGMIS